MYFEDNYENACVKLKYFCYIVGCFCQIEIFLLYSEVLKRVPHNLEVSLQGSAIASKGMARSASLWIYCGLII